MDREMISAIRSKDGDRIKELAKDMPDLFDKRSPQDNTALHIAARYGNSSVVSEILNFRGSFLFEKNCKGETPLHLAVLSGNKDVSRTLLKYKYQGNGEIGGVNTLRIHDDEGNLPLHIAVKHNHIDMALHMLELDPALVRCVNKAEQSPLSVAIDSSDLDFAFLICKEDPEGHNHGEDLIKLLRAVILKKKNYLYRRLLSIWEKQVNFMDVDEKGRNLLHYAAAAGNDSIAKELLLTNPSLAYKGDNYGETPLHLAARNGQLSSLKNLINTCPDATEVLDRHKRNILHTAAVYGQVNIVSFLLTIRELEDFINSCDAYGLTPLHLAAGELNIGVINCLLKNEKVKIRATDRAGQTALQLVEELEDSQKTFQKHLTIKALKAAYADQALKAEDILDNYPFYRTSNRDGNSGHKDMAQTLSLIGTLVATFTFTAAFTIPGGFISDGPDQGLAALARKTAFRTFVVTDTIAMTSSMSAAMLVFWTFWRSGSEAFMDTLPLAIGLIWVGLVSMTIAFVTGLFVVLSKNLTLAIVVCCIGCALPLIFYVVAPLSPLLLSKAGLAQMEDNPFAFTLRMVKMLFVKLFAIIWRPFGICLEATKYYIR